MSKKQYNLLLGICSLVIGGVIYICLRETSHIAVIARKIPLISSICTQMQWTSNDFVVFYLPDLLWSMALGCFLCTIHGSTTKSVLVSAAVSASSGFVWEFLQFLDIVSGTADIVDISMYLIAALFVIIMNLGGKKT